MTTDRKVCSQQIHLSRNTDPISLGTCNVLLKNNFGSFEEVLPNDENLLSSSDWAAVKTLLQDLWQSCWLGWRSTPQSHVWSKEMANRKICVPMGIKSSLFYNRQRPRITRNVSFLSILEMVCLVVSWDWHRVCRGYSLQRMGDERTCRVRTDPSGSGMLTLKASLARVLFFFDPATPIRASTSALRNFKIPTQSTLETIQESILRSFNLKSNGQSNALPYARVMSLLGSRGISITVVPSMSTSLQAVVLRPVTLQAW